MALDPSEVISVADWVENELTEATSLSGSELFICLQGGTIKSALPGLLYSFKQAKVSLNNTQISGLGTQLQIVAPPGSGKFYDGIRVYYRVRFGTTPYDTNTNIQLLYGDSGQSITASTSVLSASEDSIIKPSYTTNAFNLPVANIVNKGIDIKCPSGNPLNGDGELDIYISYQTITL